MKALYILIACEVSGMVREAFGALGHKVWSCDTEPTDRKCTANTAHIVDDARECVKGFLGRPWDIVIAHPPCRYLAVSGAHLFDKPGRRAKQREALSFVRAMMKANAHRVCIENPVSVISSQIRKPDQIIHPWQFGHREAKTTCLWLKNLPPLKPTRVMKKPACGYWLNQTPSGQNKLGPSPDRSKRRAKTYAGIARAMANQWGGALMEMVIQCAWCLRVKSEGHWLPMHHRLLSCSHGICPTCKVRVEREAATVRELGKPTIRPR